MKKVFTLIAAALMAAGAQAQLYNFSDAAWGDERVITSDFTVGPITLKAGDGQDSQGKNNEAFTLDSNSKTIDGIKCTRRWKTGGSTNINGTRSIAVTLGKNKTLSVAGCSSSSNSTRTLFFATEPGNDETAATVLKSFVDEVGSTPTVFSYTHTGDEATIYICCKGGGTNYYFVNIEDYVDPSTATAKTWDFSTFTEQVSLHGDGTTPPTLQYDGLTLVGVKSAASGDLKDYVSAEAGFHGNGQSDANSRYISYKPAADGILKATFKSNKAEDAANRTTAIGTTIKKGATATGDGVLAIATAETGVVEANVTAGTTYFIWFAVGGQAITKVEYVPGGSSGISTIKAGTAVQDGVKYNLAGQKVSNDYKGVVIMNGKKVMMK